VCLPCEMILECIKMYKMRMYKMRRKSWDLALTACPKSVGGRGVARRLTLKEGTRHRRWVSPNGVVDATGCLEAST
jgi:hypothetical protein